MNDTKPINYNQLYENLYSNLNSAQKKAVDHIEGPVLVMAGPGTGKTQVLAMRIAKILQVQDINPHNILCLTFTDSASHAMRQRLVRIIGPTAHRIHIFTFHAFCNQVIRENPETFGNYRQFDLISDIEKIDILHEILDELENEHILKRLKGEPGFEAKRLDNLFTLMKKENLSASAIETLCDEYLTRRKSDKEDSELYYQINRRPNKKGDLKEKPWGDLVRKMEELKAASNLFDKYQSKCSVLGRYDYQDMILWVLEKFTSDEFLLAKYQERYQYVLVDEYQDTSGAQNRLLELLLAYWDQPNVFVVGDDDQAIYKFQGANLKNIQQFDKKYQPQKVVLNGNYRSTQKILDASQALIELNQERMARLNPEIKKSLVAKHSDRLPDEKPNIRIFQTRIHELVYIYQYLEKQNLEGADLSQIAVVYRNHAQVETLSEITSKKRIPIQIKQKVNILQNELVRCILTIMTYIDAEYKKAHSREDLLFEIMHYRFFQIPPLDIAKIPMASRFLSELFHNRWREIIQNKKLLDKMEMRASDKFLFLSRLIEKWITDMADLTLQNLFENIINESGILHYIMNHPDRSWILQVVTTLFDKIKEESNKNPTIKPGEFLDMIEKMKSNNLAIPVQKIIFNEKGVNFVTTHSAKGLEFDKVFIIGCTSDIWDKQRRSGYSYSFPDTINQDTDSTPEDERRLFFVGMTRAKTGLSLSYSKFKEDGKELGPCQFIDELSAANLCKTESPEINDQKIEEFHILDIQKFERPVPPLIEGHLIKKELENYRLSVTGLNKYIKCPLSFYFENILKVPTARNKYMGFGRAIHRALQIYTGRIAKSSNGDVSWLTESFEQGLNEHRSHFTEKEFVDLQAYGKIILKQYYDQYLPLKREQMTYIAEHKIDFSEFRGVPIKGILDRVDVSGNQVHVVDYKTGNHTRWQTRSKLKRPKTAGEEGGEYWRQIVFYKILIDGDKATNWRMKTGEIDFVEPDRKTNEFCKETYTITGDEVEQVGKLIEDTWANIQAHRFDRLCEEEDCYWCNFVKNDYFIDQRSEPETEDLVQDQ